jgi:hypothetical protein
VAGYYAMAGYRASGERAIRIDMLERLADMLRDLKNRACQSHLSKRIVGRGSFNPF